MTRRALPKIDPTLDLSHHLQLLAGLSAPCDPPSLFPGGSPVELEIGSGKGLFLVSAAAQYPERNFLGIEISGKYARFTAARLARLGRANARIVHGDARRFVAEYLPAARLAAVHVYFPDPWWKKRHHKRRLLNESFVAQLERILEPQGRLHFWTDVEAYFQSAVEVIRASTRLEGPLSVPEQPAEHDLDYRTHFERRMRLHQLPVYRSEFRKPA